MSIALPIHPQQPLVAPECFNILLPGAIDGVGKSTFLASVPNILIMDPDKSCKALETSFAPVDLKNWTECQEFLRLLQNSDLKAYSGLGIDNLNVFFDYLFAAFIKKEGHPGDKNDMGKTWNKLNREWIGWVRSIRQATNGLFIATCHTNIIEIVMRGQKFNRWIPAIPGGGARGAYRLTMEAFDIIGFMTREPKEGFKEQALVPPKDMRADLTGLQTEKDSVVIHFLPSIYYEAKDNSSRLPHKLALSQNGKEDWSRFLEAWEKEGEK